MSEEKQHRATSDPEDQVQSVNIRLIYSLIALAMLAAIAIAFFIVLPFYRHR